MNYYIRKEYIQNKSTFSDIHENYIDIKSRRVDIEYLENLKQALKRIQALRSELNDENLTNTSKLNTIYLCQYEDDINKFEIIERYSKPLSFTQLAESSHLIEQVYYNKKWYYNDRNKLSKSGFYTYNVSGKWGMRRIVDEVFIPFKNIAMNDEIMYLTTTKYVL